MSPQVVSLKDHADLTASQPASLVFIKPSNRIAADPYRARARLVEAGRHLEQGGFAAAGRPGEGHEFTPLDAQVGSPQSHRLHRA